MFFNQKHITIPAQIRLWLSTNPQIARQHYRDSLKRLNEILKSL